MTTKQVFKEAVSEQPVFKKTTSVSSFPWKGFLSQTPGNLTHDLFISPDERENSVICAKLQKSVAQPRRIISKNTPFPTSLKDNFLPFSPFSCTERDKMCKEYAFICPNICLEEEIFIPLQRI